MGIGEVKVWGRRLPLCPWQRLTICTEISSWMHCKILEHQESWPSSWELSPLEWSASAGRLFSCPAWVSTSSALDNNRLLEHKWARTHLLLMLWILLLLLKAWRSSSLRRRTTSFDVCLRTRLRSTWRCRPSSSPSTGSRWRRRPSPWTCPGWSPGWALLGGSHFRWLFYWIS